MIQPLSQSNQNALLDSGAWSKDAPVAMDRLVKLKLNYIDFEGLEHTDGELIVLDAVAPALEKIFDQLLADKFPIAKMRCISSYGADDLASMTDNNCSAFNSRKIQGTGRFSIHSYGTAVDINPLQNPILLIDEDNGDVKVEPKAGWQYINRANQKPGMVEKLVSLFDRFGFTTWGGTWTTPIDYHHFQTSRNLAELLAVLPAQAAKALFEHLIENRELNQSLSQAQAIDTDSLVAAYFESETEFFGKLPQLIGKVS